MLEAMVNNNYLDVPGMTPGFVFKPAPKRNPLLHFLNIAANG